MIQLTTSGNSWPCFHIDIPRHIIYHIRMLLKRAPIASNYSIIPGTLVEPDLSGVCSSSVQLWTYINRHLYGQFSSSPVPMLTVSVQVPQGATGGSTIQIIDPTSGRPFQVQVPAGLNPGDTFNVDVLRLLLLCILLSLFSSGQLLSRASP